MQFNLRKWSIHDAASLQSNANNSKIANNLRDNFPHPYTLADAFWYINYAVTQDEKKELYRAIEAENQAIGSIGLVFKKSGEQEYGELGYWLGEKYWNQGIMTRAVKMMCDIAFSDFPIDYIIAEIYVENVSSMRVLEKAHFVRDKLNPDAIVKTGLLRSTYSYLKKR